MTYPASTSGYRLKLKYDYQYGLLHKVSDFNAATTVFWQAEDVDARGNVTRVYPATVSPYFLRKGE